MNKNNPYDMPSLIMALECTTEHQKEVINLIRCYISDLLAEAEELSEYICYLEVILEQHEIEF